jgi:hypothetical protein
VADGGKQSVAQIAPTGAVGGASGGGAAAAPAPAQLANQSVVQINPAPGNDTNAVTKPTPAPNTTGQSTLTKIPPLSFMLQSKYYKVYETADPTVNINDNNSVNDVISRAVLKKSTTDGGQSSYAVTSVSSRKVDPTTDGELLSINPNAVWISNITGTNADGSADTETAVVDDDGTTYVDPRAR